MLRFKIVQLDACGRIPTTAGTLPVYDDTKSIQSIGFTPQVKEGDRESLPSVDGTLCIDSTGPMVNQGSNIELLGCGINRPLESYFGWYRPTLNGATLIGYDEIDPDPDAQVLIEMMWKLPSTLCDASGAEQVIAAMWQVNAWKPNSNGQTWNGQTTTNLNWTGQSAKISTRLFELFPAVDTPSGEFAHWANFWPTYTGDAWARWIEPIAIPAPVTAITKSTTVRDIVS